MPADLEGVLPSSAFGCGRFSEVSEIRLVGIAKDAPPRYIVRLLTEHVKVPLYECMERCAELHPRYQTKVETWRDSHPVQFRPVDVLWGWMQAARGIAVLQRYNLVLATMLETFAGTKESFLESTSTALTPPKYYEIGNEFVKGGGSGGGGASSAGSSGGSSSMVLQQEKDVRSVLRGLMVHEERALEDLNDEIVQRCLLKNDYSGAINVFLNRQFNTLQLQVPFMIGSGDAFKRGRGMVLDLAEVLRAKERRKKQEEGEASPPKKKSRRLKDEENQPQQPASNVTFMEIDKEEDEFERMLREATTVGGEI
jgi:hypothetical protein